MYQEVLRVRGSKRLVGMGYLDTNRGYIALQCLSKHWELCPRHLALFPKSSAQVWLDMTLHPLCHDYANSIPIWTNSTLLLVYSDIPISTLMFLLPTPMFLPPTPMFLLPTPTFLLLLQRLAFLSHSCHSFRYILCFLLSPTCQSVALLPTYPFHVFSPFHVILLLHFFDTFTWLVFITRILSFQSVYKSSCNSSVLPYEYQLGLVLILLLCLILSNSSDFRLLQSPPSLCLSFLRSSKI